MMLITSVFPDRRGAMSCVLSACFCHRHHAVSYIRGILQTPMMRLRISHAELHGVVRGVPLLVDREGERV